MKTYLKITLVIMMLIAFPLNKAMGQCVTGLNYTSISAGSGGGEVSPTIYVAPLSCTGFTVTNGYSWISYVVQGPRVIVSVQPNNWYSRDGYLVIGGYQLTVHQDGICNPIAAPTGINSDRDNICSNEGGQITLTAVGGSGNTLRWFQGSCTGTFITTSTGSISVAAPNTTTTYSVQWENSCGGVSGCMSKTITVRPIAAPPDRIVVDHSDFCPGAYQNITLTSYLGAGTTLVWSQGSCDGPSIGTTNPLTIPAPASTTTYYAHWENSCDTSGCTSITVVVKPHASPPTDINVDRHNICPNSVGTINLSTSGGSGDHLYWALSCHGDIIGQGYTLNLPVPASNTNYYAWWQTDCGEVSQCKMVSVFVNNSVSVPTVQPINIDYKTQAILEAKGAKNYEEGYHWYSNSTGGSYLNGSSDTYTTPPLTSNTTYFVAIYNLGDQCESLSRTPLDITVFAPNNNNFIRETTVLDSAVIDQAGVSSAGVSKIVKYSYFDGLGRPMQTVLLKGSPATKDIIQPTVYDAFGRESTKYLPFVDGGNDGYYRSNELLKANVYSSSDQFKFYQAGESIHPQDVASDQYPYAESLLELSPLNRIMQQGAPGSSWQLSQNHTIKLNYETNTSNDVRNLQIDNSGNCTNTDGYYPANKLFKTTTKNENWNTNDDPLLNTNEEFKDKQGQVILKRSYVKNEAGTIDHVETYYVYDDFGLLRYVIPPKASAVITFPVVKNDAIVKSLCYYYEYDSRKRMTIKQIPGAEPVYMIYDSRDRLVLTQDGNQRNHKNTSSQPDPQWLFTKYDCYNRSIMTGFISIAETNPAIIQSNVNTYYSSNDETHRYENTTTDLVGYTLTNSYPDNIAESNILTITYYDTYGISTSQPFILENGQLDKNSRLIGKVTGGKVRILGNTTDWLMNTVYYDHKYRVIQSIKANQFPSGIDRVSNKYYFSGWLKRSYTTHSHTGITSITALRLFGYDPAGRLTMIKHSTNGQTPIILSYMKYNELGQLVDKKIHSTDSGIQYLQSIDYRYNIRGWLTHINNPDLGNIPGTSPTIDDPGTEKPDAFGMQIGYDLDF